MTNRGVSIIVPIHGDTPFLEAALESILDQELSENFEVVYSFDRPSEMSMHVARLFMSANTKIVESALPGVANAHNTGLHSASFDLIAVMHTDDIMLPGRLQAQLRFLRENDFVVCVGGQTQLIDNKGSIIGNSLYPTSYKRTRKLMKLHAAVAHPAVMYRRDVAIAAGGYNQEFAPAEDFALWREMMKFGEFTNLRQPVLQYRVHNKQTSNINNKKQSEARALIITGEGRNDKRSSTIHEEVQLNDLLQKIELVRRSKKWNMVIISKIVGQALQKHKSVLFQLALNFIINRIDFICWRAQRFLRN